MEALVCNERARHCAIARSVTCWERVPYMLPTVLFSDASFQRCFGNRNCKHMRKIYTIVLISFFVFLLSSRGLVLPYHGHGSALFNISHVYADDGGDGGGDGGDGDGDGGGDGGDGDDDGGDGGGDDGGDDIETPPQPPPSVPTCPLTPKDGRTIVNLGSGSIISSGTLSAATKGPVSVSISAGTYDISLVYYDNHLTKLTQVQPNESWFLVLKDNLGLTIATTSAISDLESNEEFKEEKVETNLVLASSTASITAIHAAFSDINPNSITPLCVAFDEVVVSPPPPPPPVCPLPTIISELSATSIVNQLFSYTLTATTTGVVSTTTSFTVATSSLPNGLSYSTSTNTISGISTETGTFNIAISATNDCGIDAKTFVLVVNPLGGGGSSPSANLAVTKTVDKSTASVGDTITYTITLTNNGPSDATGVSVTDAIPSELNFVSATSTTGSYSTTTGMWTIGDLMNSSSTVLTLSATIKSGNEGRTITNTSIASGTQTDPVSSDNTSSADVKVNDTPSCTTNCDGGGGGGGGSSSGSGGGGSSRPSTSTSTVTEAVCFYLRDYMRRDFANDPIEVLKLQGFLRNFEGHSEVTLTGVFDQATFDAVSAFQMKYFSDILEPWGHTGPTGYVYILTLKKINEIYCQRIFPLNQSQVNEIAAFRALLDSLRTLGVDVELPPPSESGSVEERGLSTTTPIVIPIVGEAEPPQGQNLRNLAAAIFALPDNLLDIIKCSYEFLLVIIVLYILGNVLKDVLYKNIPENAKKRFFTKWLTIDVGMGLAIVAAYMMRWWCVILPLMLALILSLIWTSTYSKHNSIRASIKSWYLVGSLRIKSIWKENQTIFKGKLGKRAIEKEKISEKEEPETVIILPKLISKEDKSEKGDAKITVAGSTK